LEAGGQEMNRIYLSLLTMLAFATASVIGLNQPGQAWAASDQPAATAQAPFQVSRDPPQLAPRKPCQLIDDWINMGGTRANFSGIGVGGLSKPLPHCFPLLAKISHTAQERYVDPCGQTHWEVNLAYDAEHEGELWLSGDLSQAFVNIQQSAGGQRSFRLRRGDGFYFAGHDHTGCKHYDRQAFAGARQNPYMGVKLTLYAPPDMYGQRLFYMPPLLEEPSRMLSYTSSTWFSINPANESKVSFSLSVEELLGLRKGHAVTRELTWGGEERGTGHYWTNRMSFELRGLDEAGILHVTPTEGLIARGPDKSGRFNPTSKTYTLKNTGKSSIDYSISKTKTWLDLSQTKGTLGPGASAPFKVSINRNAKTLKKGDSDSIKFANLTNGQGNTTRQVKLSMEEQWRVVFEGWNNLFFGDNVLAGGLKVHWVVMVDFKIREGKYEDGKGKAYFRKLESHSHPPGVYDCVPLKGVYWDKSGNKSPTPYIANENFNVPGVKKGSMVSFTLPGNLYVVGYHCVMDSDRAKEAFKGVGAIKAEDRVRSSRKDASIEDVRYLPSGTKEIPLKDGWTKQFGHTKSIDAHRILVHRAK
jgi:hypothetical protein